MKKILVMKALLMIFLIVTTPLTISSVSGESDFYTFESDSEEMLSPEQQCFEKTKKGEEFLNIMDNGVIELLEKISAVLWGIATIINTIDYFINLISTTIGMFGPGNDICCTSVVGATGACQANYALFNGWQGLKTYGWVQGIVDFATCACCSNPGTGVDALKGGALGMCPVGNIAGMLTDNGISSVEVGAFDNIYLAAGCMCPVAILFNLRKLKTIYQVYNCCVREACLNGVSLEACEKQYDEATCMYWEGSIIKTAITIVASIVTRFIAQHIWKIFEDNLLARCILMVMDMIRIPARIKAVMGSFDWLKQTFNEPECKELKFEDIRERLESDWDSESAGVHYVLADSDGDGIADNTYENKEDPKKKKKK